MAVFAYLLACYYVFWKCFLTITLPALVVGFLGYMLVDASPTGRSIPVAILLGGMATLLSWQLQRTHLLGKRLSELEDWREEYFTRDVFLDEEELINPS